MMTTRRDIIQDAVKKLRKLGFVHVNADNILRDEAYRIFFKKILQEEAWKNSDRFAVIEGLLKEIESDNAR